MTANTSNLNPQYAQQYILAAISADILDAPDPIKPTAPLLYCKQSMKTPERRHPSSCRVSARRTFQTACTEYG